MKKSIRMLMLLALAGTATAMATPVSQQRAAQVAELFVSQQYDAPAGLKLKTIETLNDQLYLVNFSPCGWAIVSNDDAAEPIVGYSTTSNITKQGIPENMAFMMGEAAKTVDMYVRKGAANKVWNRIENGSYTLSRAGEPVEPLIQVNWNQGSPYNKYCPGSGSSQAVVGCVAVAMSQAMSVQQYPERPSGRWTYNSANYGTITIDYDMEEPYNWADIMSGANNKDEVARLLYHAGVSVSMDYGVDGSGIPSNQTYRITNALKNIFGYADDVEVQNRESYSGDWEQLLLNELYAGHALVYNAIDSKGGYGHSFNIDGYNSSGLYHVNWGWGGYGNGYFSINSLSDAQMDMNYDSYHRCVTGIGAPNSAIRNVGLSDTYVEVGTSVNSPFCAVLVNGDLATMGNFSVTVTGEYDAYTSKYKDVPFKYSNGLLTLSQDLTAADANTTIYTRVVVTDKDSGIKMTAGFNIVIEEKKAIEHRTALSYDRTSNMFTVKTKFGSKWAVKNPQGASLMSGEISTSPYFEFSRSLLSTGTNTVEVTSDGETKVLKIVL